MSSRKGCLDQGWMRSALRCRILGAIIVACSMGVVNAKDAACADADTVAQLRTELTLAQLQADLLRERSATKVLEQWCGKYRLAKEAVVRAEVMDAPAKVASAETMNRLRVSKPEELAYRRVGLRCGAVLLSEADNWYVPTRLTKAMNAMLASSDVPFGKVIAELKPFRVTITAKPLWTALENGEACMVKPVSATKAPAAVLEVQALLYREDLKPFSEVHEVYQRPLIDAAASCAKAP